VAFIAKLHDGHFIRDNGTVGVAVSYGPHATAYALASGSAALVEGQQGPMLASVSADGTYTVALDRLTPILTPYANRFLAGTGVVVIKDWRSGAYRVKTRSAKNRRQRAAKMAVVTPAAKPRPVTLPMPTPEPQAAPQPVLPAADAAAVITMTPDNVAKPIPGMVYPTGRKVSVKSAGPGWTNMDGFVMRDEDVATLDRAWALRQQGRPAAVLITGPAGTAKTMMVQSFAAKLNVPYLKVDCAPIRTVDDWAGGLKQDPATKTWAHRWSPFAKALREGKPCVILLDELTRTETPAALNGVLGLLDETGTMLVPDANDVLRLPKGILIIATANIGPEFVGTLPLDGAVRQRFMQGIRMDYPTEALEAKLLCDRSGITRDVADMLVRMAVQQRKHRDDAQRFPSGSIISTRLLLGMADNIRHGAPHRDAVWSVLKAQFDPADEPALTVLVDAQFPKNAPKVSPAEPATILTGRHYFQAAGGTVNSCGFVQSGQTCGLDPIHPIHISK
jgi:MoxR-like ATPase